MEKRGQLDTLRNQIIERKVIDRIMEKAEFEDVPMDAPVVDTSAIDHLIGHRTEIADAEHDEGGGTLREQPERG